MSSKSPLKRSRSRSHSRSSSSRSRSRSDSRTSRSSSRSRSRSGSRTSRSTSRSPISRRRSRSGSRSPRRRSPRRKERSPSPQTKVHVGNLTRNVTEEHLNEIFGTYGKIKRTELVWDRKIGQPKGFAYVEYETNESVVSAIARMDGAQIDGQQITVQYTHPKRIRSPRGWRRPDRRFGAYRRWSPVRSRQGGWRGRGGPGTRRWSPRRRSRSPDRRRSRSPSDRRRGRGRSDSRSPSPRRKRSLSRSPSPRDRRDRSKRTRSSATPERKSSSSR